MMGSSKHVRRPTLACEIAADRILAGRAADAGRSVEVSSARELAPGTVVPDLMESNLRDRAAVRQAIESALGSVAGRTKDVIAILPDTAVRVVLLDFEALPPKREEYEAAFRDAGYSPGVVMPSMLAALGAADAERPTLVVKVDARTISLAILDQEQLLLFRTLENMRGVTITGDQLAEEVYPSVVFFQDTYNLNIERVYVAGLPESGGAAPALKAQSGAQVEELVTSSQIGSATGTVPRWRMAGVVGALIS